MCVYISRESSLPAPSNFPRAFHTDATRPLLVVRAYIAAAVAVYSHGVGPTRFVAVRADDAYGPEATPTSFFIFYPFFIFRFIITHRFNDERKQNINIYIIIYVYVLCVYV